jgi:hypothetical protein
VSVPVTVPPNVAVVVPTEVTVGAFTVGACAIALVIPKRISVIKNENLKSSSLQKVFQPNGLRLVFISL